MNCCDNCKHKHVCKYKEAVDKFSEKIDTVLDDILDNQNIFSVEVKCINHSWDYPKEWDQPGVKELHGNKWDDGLRVKGITLPNALPTDGTNSNPCEHCSTYKMLTDSKVYIGDLPCQWCDKSPLRVTCESK